MALSFAASALAAETARAAGFVGYTRPQNSKAGAVVAIAY